MSDYERQTAISELVAAHDKASAIAAEREEQARKEKA